MRQKQLPLLLLTAASLGFLVFLVHFSYADNSACNKACPSGGPEKKTGNSPGKPPISHMIASIQS